MVGANQTGEHNVKISIQGCVTTPDFANAKVRGIMADAFVFEEKGGHETLNKLKNNILNNLIYTSI